MEKNELKERLLKMATVFHEFCQKNGIRYYMLGGTMLGAVRHKGFIPWDDDMDFGIMREDYEKLKTLRNQLPDGYSLNFFEYNKNFQYGFCKLYDENSTYIEGLYDDKAVGGLYIDIFPIDDIGDDWKKAEEIGKKIVFRKKVVAAIYAKGQRSSSIKTLGVKAMSLLPKTSKWFEWVYKVVEKYRGKNSKIITNVFGAYTIKEILPKEFFGEPELYKFENTQFYGVEKPHEYLTRLYGDYMTPPPEDKRGGHNIVYVDLETPYKEYLKKKEGEKK